MFHTNKLNSAIAISAFSAVIIFSASQLWAGAFHGGSHDRGVQATIGSPGNTATTTRTINIKMLDNYFEPREIFVNEGETIRFVVKNAGELVHEFNIGNVAMHANHQKEMIMMEKNGVLGPDTINHDKMKMHIGSGKTFDHNDQNSILLEPGKSGEVIWQFAKSNKIEFACNIPGHYESGMKGPIRFNIKNDPVS